MNKIRLNHPCIRCKKTIYLGDGGTILEGEPLHYKCYKQRIVNDILEIIADWETTNYGNTNNRVDAFQKVKEKIKTYALEVFDEPRGEK